MDAKPRRGAEKNVKHVDENQKKRDEKTSKRDLDFYITHARTHHTVLL